MEDLPAGLRLILLLALLGVNSFFAAAEVALVSVRKTRLRELAAAGSRSARLAIDLADAPGRMLSATQLGVTVASLALGWVAESALYPYIQALFDLLPLPPAEGLLHGLSFGLAFFGITFLHMVLGEVVPKNLAIARSERLALAVAPPLQVFAAATRPFVSLVRESAALISRLAGLRMQAGDRTYSADELKHVFDSIGGQGGAHGARRELLERAIDFYDLTVREIMVPRKDLISLPASASLDQTIDCLARHRHSRLPIYEGSPEHLVGVLYAKDFWGFILQRRSWRMLDRPPPRFVMTSHMRELEFVPETKKLFELLEDFQKRQFQMAAVVDEFGTVAGVVTVEDAVEQIVGEIRDVHDPPGTQAVGGPLELDGITNIVDLDAIHGIELPSDAGFETLAGFLLSRLGHLPTVGETVRYDGRRFTVQKMDRNRIGMVLVQSETAAPAGDGPDDA